MCADKPRRPLENEGQDEMSARVKLEAQGLELTAGTTHRVAVYASYEDFKSGSKPVSRGQVTLTQTPFADWGMTNMDGADLPDAPDEGYAS